MKRLLVALLGALACVGAFAQTRVVLLGTQGGPMPFAGRAQPANAVIVRDRIYLVDAGNGVVRQLTMAGLDHRRIGHIFITHNHDDHNADWGTLLGLQWSTGRREETHVYGPSGTESMLQGFLQYFAPNVRIRMGDGPGYSPPGLKWRAHDIQGTGLVFRDDLVTVTAMENCHYVEAAGKNREGPDKSFAFRFQTPDKVVVFSGDTGNCPSMVGFARDADLLVHEVIDIPLISKALRGALPPQLAEGLLRHMVDEHTTAEDVGKLAHAAKVRRVVLTHIIPGQDEPDSTYLEPLKKHFSGPAVVARDLMSF